MEKWRLWDHDDKPLICIQKMATCQSIAQDFFMIIKNEQSTIDNKGLHITSSLWTEATLGTMNELKQNSKTNRELFDPHTKPISSLNKLTNKNYFIQLVALILKFADWFLFEKSQNSCPISPINLIDFIWVYCIP